MNFNNTLSPFKYFPLLTLAFFYACAPVKKVTVSVNSGIMKETYFVKKSDPAIKQGHYLQAYYGIPITEGDYKDDKRTGTWYFNDYAGKINFSGSYNEGLKQGLWTYYDNARVKCRIYHNHGTVDSAFAFHDNGKLSYEMELDENKNGLVKSYYKSGALKDLFPVKNHRVEGIYKLYFENGQLHRETEIKAGREIKILKTYDLTGGPLDGGALEGGDGTMIQYYLPDDMNDRSLKKYRVDTYEDGILNGESKLYGKNGRLEETGQYKNGYLSGPWQLYKEDGNLLSQVNYDADTTHPVAKSENTVIYFSEAAYERDETKLDFQGGEKERVLFIQRSVNYPRRARADGVEGKVFINFVISENGELLKYRLIKKVNPELDAEVIRILKLMPRWNPSFHNGLPGKTSYNMPINFRLK
ncbi:MAG: TonB family protein [Bacteroidota bacterium]